MIGTLVPPVSIMVAGIFDVSSAATSLLLPVTEQRIALVGLYTVTRADICSMAASAEKLTCFCSLSSAKMAAFTLVLPQSIHRFRDIGYVCFFRKEGKIIKNHAIVARKGIFLCGGWWQVRRYY